MNIKTILKDFDDKFGWKPYTEVDELHFRIEVQSETYNNVKKYLLLSHISLLEEMKESIPEDEEITCDLPDIIKMCQKCEEGIIRNQERQRQRTSIDKQIADYKTLL